MLHIPVLANDLGRIDGVELDFLRAEVHYGARAIRHLAESLFLIGYPKPLNLKVVLVFALIEASVLNRPNYIRVLFEANINVGGSLPQAVQGRRLAHSHASL